MNAPELSAAPELTVVIPAYNEEARIGATLEKVLAYLEARQTSFEVLVVDDGSRPAARIAGGSLPRADAGRRSSMRRPRARLRRPRRRHGHGGGVHRRPDGIRVLAADAARAEEPGARRVLSGRPLLR